VPQFILFVDLRGRRAALFFPRTLGRRYHVKSLGCGGGSDAGVEVFYMLWRHSRPTERKDPGKRSWVTKRVSKSVVTRELSDQLGRYCLTEVYLYGN
jgi:hypothetical protein